VARARVHRERCAGVQGASVVCGDFFSADLGGQFDFTFDYTFFCALPPSLREKWGRRHAELLKPGGKLLTLAFPIGTDEVSAGLGGYVACGMQGVQTKRASLLCRPRQTQTCPGHRIWSALRSIARRWSLTEW
jgi:hypothetical protein